MIARIIRLAGTITILTVLASFIGRAQLAEAGSPTAYADGNGARACAGLLPCYLTVQDAVNHVGGPGDASVMVFPGTYNESINLNNMASAIDQVFGNLTLKTVDAAGNPSPGTATIHGAAAISTTTEAFPKDITLDGFIAESTEKDGVYIKTAGSITIRHMTANNPGDGSSTDNTGDDGFDLATTGGGSVTIEDTTAEHAHGNLGDGIQIVTTGGATIRNTTASNNIGSKDNAGINIPDSKGDVVLDNVTADNNTEQGIYVYTTGTITLSGGEANNNGFRGADFFTEFGTPISTSTSIANAVPQQSATGVTVDGFTANGNADDGILAQAFPDIVVRNTQADNNGKRGMELLSQQHVEATNTHVENNHNLGIYIEANTNVAIDRVGAINNGGGGLKIVGFGSPLGSVTVHDSFVNRNTGQGIDIFNLKPSGPNDISSNIICGNSVNGLRNNGTSLTISAAGNWWGAASGPKAAGNPGGTGDQINSGGTGTFVFAPWINHVEATELAQPAAATSVPSTIVFTFQDDAHTVQLENNPGDNLVQGQAPFTISTDNGVLETQGGAAASVHGYIANTQLRVTLIATHAGVANVTLTGPCGLTDQITVGVVTGNPWGDLDCNGSIGILDLLRSLQFTATVSPGVISGCAVSPGRFDLNCGGTADGQDPLLLLLHLAALQPTFHLPDGCPAVGT